MSANGCSTSTGNIANNVFGNKNISGSIILKSKNNSQKRSANTIIKAHDNVAENEGYKMILPSTKGTAEQVLKIDSVTNNLLNLSWGEGGGGGSDITVQDEGSSLATAATTLNFTGENVTASGTGATKTINITSDTYSQYSLETSQFSLLSGLTFDSGGGNFSKFFSNSNGNSEFVRFSVSSYPQSFTWTPHTSEVNYPLTKVVMWTRDTNSVNDIEMFPTQFKIYGRPTAGSSTGETEIGNIILSSQPSRSDNLLISSAAVNSVINTNKVVYSQYRIEIYENNSSGFSNKPLIGELRFYRPSSVQQYGNELTNWTENGDGHIIPSENSLYDIGSAEKKVRHLYLSNNSLNIGGVVLSSENDDIKIGDKKLLKEDENQKIPSGKLPISVTHSDNFLSTLTIGDNTYNMPSGGSGGGTSVTANPGGTPSTTLSTVTIAGIDYTLPGDDLVGTVLENFTYGGSTALTYLSSTHSVSSGSIKTGLHTLTNGVKVSTNWNRSGFDNRAVYECFDGNLFPGYTFNAVSDNYPPHVNSEYNSGHYVWVDIELPNPSKITNLRMWTRSESDLDHRFPEKFQWYAQAGTQPNASSYTTTGDYVQPNASDLGNWTSITSLFSGTITGTTSNTPTSSNHTYDVSVSDAAYYDRIRLVVTKGSSSYSTQGGFIIGEIQIDGAFQKPVVESLSAIANVSLATPSDGQALVYDETADEWQPGTVGSTLTVQDEGSSLSTAATTLNFVGSGVTASGTDATKIITINVPSELSDIGNVSSTAPSDGQTLAYNSSASQWQPRSVLSSTSIVGLNLLAQANYWVVAGDSSERSHGYTLEQSGSITVSQDSDNYKYFVTNASTKFYFIDASSNNAAIDQHTQTSSYAFVVDFDNNGSGNGDVNVLQQRNTEQYTDGNYSHQILFYDRNSTGDKTNGNLIYNNHQPGYSDGVFPLGTQSIGSRKMYVITVEPNPSNTSQEKTSLYEIQSNGNVQLLGTDAGEDTYTGTPDTENYIILGSGNTNSATRWYGLAAWPRTLSSFEISLLSESLLLEPQSNYVTNFPVSSTAPTDGQALVYSGTQWVPSLPVMPFFELFGIGASKTFSNDAYLTIVESSGSTDANMSGTSFGINKYGTSVPTTSDSVELLQDAVYKIDYSISLNYTSDVRFVYLQFRGASSADGTYSTVRTSVVNTYENLSTNLEFSILSGSVLYSTTSSNRFLKFYLKRSSTVKIHSNTAIDYNISPVYNSIIFQRIK